jgi:adenylate cyclase
MRVQIDAIADQTGMRGVFRLRSVEVLRVDRCEQVEGSVGRLRRPASGAGALDGLSVFAGRLDDCRELGELTQTALELLDDLFGIGSSMLLMADHDLKSLFVVAHHGYASGVGAEIAVGDGVIGVAAQRRRQVLVSHVTRAQALYRAAARSQTAERHEIPLPGLAGAQSLVAAPILLRGRLMGVLYVDSAEAGRFGTADGQLIDVIARHIGMSIGLLDTTADDLNLSPGPRRAGAKPGAGSGARSVSFHDPDGTVLIDGDYIIRGVAGRILFAMLTEYQRSGRVRFSNRELRLNRDIGLPAGNDNLDARLVTLRRRLAERGDPFQLQSVGRGQLELIVTAAVHVDRNDPGK